MNWAFTSFDAANWHPLTWLSHALDCQMFASMPAGHHDINLLLHVINVLLLFWVLLRATGYIGRSFMVAALFALHPINVESVAWIAERKNVLSMLFFCWRWAPIAGMRESRAWPLCRGRAAVRAGPDGQAADHHLAVRAAAVGLLAAASGCLPPAAQSARSAAREVSRREAFLAGDGKAAAVGACGGQRHDHHDSAAVGRRDERRPEISAFCPLGNAVVSYVRYLGKAIWPSHLALLYPHPGNPGALAGPRWRWLLLLAITAGHLSTAATAICRWAGSGSWEPWCP